MTSLRGTGKGLTEFIIKETNNTKIIYENPLFIVPIILVPILLSTVVGTLSATHSPAALTAC